MQRVLHMKRWQEPCGGCECVSHLVPTSCVTYPSRCPIFYATYTAMMILLPCFLNSHRLKHMQSSMFSEADFLFLPSHTIRSSCGLYKLLAVQLCWRTSFGSQLTSLSGWHIAEISFLEKREMCSYVWCDPQWSRTDEPLFTHRAGNCCPPRPIASVWIWWSQSGAGKVRANVDSAMMELSGCFYCHLCARSVESRCVDLQLHYLLYDLLHNDGAHELCGPSLWRFHLMHHPEKLHIRLILCH